MVKVCSCYEDFLRRTPGSFPSIAPSAGEILDECNRLLSENVDLVAVDMPLSHSPIEGRRLSDNKVSAHYGSRQCGTHSPNASCPGLLSAKLVEEFERRGYPLRTAQPVQGGLIEVYPHPALVELMNAPERLTYKCGKVSRYWPRQTREERWQSLRKTWQLIVEALDGVFCRTVSGQLPELKEEMSARKKKAFEDAVDAVVCAWVGICALAGMAVAYGDDDSAIWIPSNTAKSFRG